MNIMGMSVQEYRSSELQRLAELLRRNRELEDLLIYGSTEQGNVINMEQIRLNNLLNRLGIKASLKGYQYLKTAITLSIRDREELEAVTKRLSPDVAKEHKTGVDKVEHAIRHAISSSWERGNRNEQERIFGYCAGEGKRPTNAEFIVGMVDYLSLLGKGWCA